MKKIENKGYGLIGIKLELEFQELIALRGRYHMVLAIIADMETTTDPRKSPFDPTDPAYRLMCDIATFLSKLTDGVGSISDAEKALFEHEPLP